MCVAFEMAVCALHPFFIVDVLELYRVSLSPLIRVVIRNLMVLRVEQIAILVVLPDVAINPAVAVEVCYLDVLQLRVQSVFRITAILHEFRIRPIALNVGSLRICHQVDRFLVRARMLGLLWIEGFTITFVVPPDGAEVAVSDSSARMHVAYDALG